jgi:hypothetical protein
VTFLHGCRPLLLLAGSLTGVLLLSGCGSDGEPAATASSSPAGGSSSVSGDSSESEPVTEGDTCAQVEELGATGASWGPVQAWLPKDDLLADIQGKLEPMADVVPPADAADAWATQKEYLETLQAAAEGLPAGGRLSDPALIAPGDEVTAAQTELTDWWFATCR